MPGVKRSRPAEDAAASSAAGSSKSSTTKKTKSTSLPSTSAPSTSLLSAQEVDFPRGGSSGLTPLEFREAKREARSESAANELLFKDAKDEQAIAKRNKNKQKLNREKRNDAKKKRAPTAAAATSTTHAEKRDHNRIEHINYKRLIPGSRLLCSVLAIHPLAVVVSLPNQMLGHIPVTQISPQFTRRLQAAADASAEDDDEDESMDEDSDSDDDDDEAQTNGTSSKRAKNDAKKVPELRDLFHVGQWLVASVLQVRSGDVAKGRPSREGGEYEKESRRVELSLAPHLVNTGVSVSDLDVGATLSATISSVEDHGYMLDSGVSEFSGFVPFTDAAKLPDSFHAGKNGKSLQVGSVVFAKITKVPDNKRSFEATLDPKTVSTSPIKHAPSITAILPGTLTKVLITAALPTGLNVNLFGMFDATIDRFHLPELPEGKDIPDVYKEGSKHVARVLWDLLSPPSTALQGDNPDHERKFGLSLAPQVLALKAPVAKDEQLLQHAYPIGATLEVTVVQTINDWGLIVSIHETDLRGFVHISQVSDDHVVSLPPSSGPFAKETVHKARVVGHSPTDRTLQLSLKASVLERKFMRVSEVEVGEVVTANIIKLGLPNAIFLQLQGHVDGVVFSNHFADVKLTQPEKRFKPGLQVRARVIDVDPNRNRIVLTLKKSLVKSDLPIVASMQDARVGVVTNATVFRVQTNSLVVSLFGGLKALIPGREVSEDDFNDVKSGFAEGKVIKMRITEVDYENQKLVGSIKQASPEYLAKLNVDAVDVGEKVTGKVAAVHKEVVVLTLVPSGVRALLSLSVLASMRGSTAEELLESLEEDQEIDDLVVSVKNPAKGIVIVADKVRSSKNADDGTNGLVSGQVKQGNVVQGRVIQKNDKYLDCIVALGTATRATLHMTDLADGFSSNVALPSPGQTLQCYIVSLKSNGKNAVISTRPSRVNPSASAEVTDPEITSIADLAKGQKVRGFVKAITNVGLFVTIGRKLDARVQVRELFDEFVRDWKTRFTVGQVVSGTIMDTNPSNNEIEMSLKSTPGSIKPRAERLEERHADADKKRAKRLTDFKVGDKVKGFVKNVIDFGVFVQIEGTNVSGLAHMNELSDGKADEALKAFRVGDKVRAIVLRINEEKRKISFGLKPSYFDAADFEDSSDEEEDEEMEADEAEVGSDDDEDDDEESGDSDDEEGDFVEMDEDSESEDDTSAPKRSAVPSLALSGGFSWSAGANDDDEESDNGLSSSDSDSDSDSDSSAAAAKKAALRKSKSKLKAQSRNALEDDLTADLATKAPSSATDFERLLLSSPNSSFLWIQFMSFSLQLSDVDRARSIARRALKVINYREEQERMNVWIALLNLENTYGSEETLESTFREAIQANDGFTMYLKMINILEKSSKTEEAEELFVKAKAKYSVLPEFWIEYARFYLRTDQPDSARALLPRAMQALEKRDHTSTITAFAINEFKLGDPERGRTIFEGLVDSYPKRLDLWWQYLDQESRLEGNETQVRNLFERAMTLKLTAKKGKSLLKKWLDYEKREGDAKSQGKVLMRAKKFVDEINSKNNKKEEEEDDEE
ncbi:U3 snoRNP-associated protein Rrp5 [Pseudozyma hubeiensis SY62]|uniref:rRNA biogenesis protein RRP5 n=1 Tax=Pseudozyma hubeiensis (strain SY62) TaxID=1305764 RepID=R9PDH8_PSEHS|nr:U3 snoRNP-associated protein Rrp5 [Pseudozyma hubeiensis SY62]GAC99433.1 U3 snoRNP-associated protein Rrp5 [Pseudozyma hubeiensis SY62]